MDLALAPARVALVGVPNCGKTALFNALTGARQKTANYPGVTVERKEGSASTPAGRRVALIDLPGTYSLRARSPDEEVTRDIVLGRFAGEAPMDLLVCVADATNLRTVLRLILELRQVGRPMVLALNMMDIAERQGFAIDLPRLSAELDVPVVTTVATRRRGVSELLEAVDRVAAEARPRPPAWSAPDAGAIRAAHREAERILKAVVTPPRSPDDWTGRLDRVLLHPAGGVAILLLVLFAMFQGVFAGAQPVMDAIDHGFKALGEVVRHGLPEGPLRDLITDGIISGVGSVLVFLPQIAILFLFILLLEDSGYMGRAAFLMDRLMGGAGLHGRAFIPLLSSFACAIPGIMSTRVIDNRRDRLTTILIAPLMTCSARIPVYTLIISAFVPGRRLWGVVDLRGLVLFGLYAAGIVSALAVAAVVRRFMWRGQSEPFLMELPSYKVPEPLNVLQGLWTRTSAFVTRAGTTILAIMILIWWLSTHPGAPAGGDAAGHRLQLRGPDRPLPRTGDEARRVRLDHHPGPDPRLRRARGGGGDAWHPLRRRRGRRGHRRPRPPAGRPLVDGHGPVAPGLVRVRAAVRLDPVGGAARDRVVAVAPGDGGLHAGPGLRRQRPRLPAVAGAPAVSALIQGVLVDAVVVAAALWLVWSFGPESWRARLTRRRAAPSYDRALQADQIDGRPADKGCGPDCGCG